MMQTRLLQFGTQALQPDTARQSCWRLPKSSRPLVGASIAVCGAASSSGRPFEDFTRSARDNLTGFSRSASKAARKKLTETYQVFDDNVRRTATQVNTKFDVTGKARQAASQVTEQAKVVESKVGLKRRMQNLTDDVQRKAPMWQKKYGEFSRTVWGQAFTLGLVFFLLYTGIAFKLLNLLFILWWLAPFILVPMSKYLNRKAAEEAMRRQAQRKARAQQNPFFSSSFFNASKRQSPPGAQQPRKYDDGGPIIDVDYKTIDE